MPTAPFEAARKWFETVILAFSRLLVKTLSSSIQHQCFEQKLIKSYIFSPFFFQTKFYHFFHIYFLLPLPSKPSQAVKQCIKQVEHLKTNFFMVQLKIFELQREKTGLRDFRPGPTQTGLCSHIYKQDRSFKFRISEEEKLYYPCSGNKGADQLRSYCKADMRLCFRIGKNPVFLRCCSFQNTSVIR